MKYFPFFELFISSRVTPPPAPPAHAAKGKKKGRPRTVFSQKKGVCPGERGAENKEHNKHTLSMLSLLNSIFTFYSFSFNTCPVLKGSRTSQKTGRRQFARERQCQCVCWAHARVRPSAVSSGSLVGYFVCYRKKRRGVCRP